MSLPIALTPGTVIGSHYIVGNLINSGGFGAVYRGVDTSEGNRPCAIKETYDVTPAARRQALMEASVLFTIRSKHLPEVYDALESNGRFYLVMQLIEGQNLLQLLRSRVSGTLVGEQEPHRQASGPCSEQEVLAWLFPIMEVLQELHSRNPPVLHRDIKPGNIILTPQQTAVLVDFGLTKLYDPTRGTQTLVKAVSEGFSPLEQYLGKTTPQSDIYSLGATMYLLLTNRLPPPAVGRSMRDELIAPRLLNPSLSLKMERALLKALAVNADYRYQSMSAFIQALREPGFNAHTDQTVLSSPAVALPPTSLASPPPPPIYQSHPYPSDPYQPSLPQRQGYQSGPDRPPYPSGSYQPSTRGYAPPTYSTPYPQLPAGGYAMAPQATWQPPVSRPSPFGQGCLWGMLQGVLAALVVLFLKKDADFSLALLMSFLFYMFAGFRTMRKGGSSARGGWAGYWTALIGAIIFALSLGIGLAVRFIQRVQTIDARNSTIDPNRAAEEAWRYVQLPWPNVMLLPDQPLWVNLIGLIVAGLLFAWLLGFVGGLLGKMLYSARLASKKRGAAYP